MNVLSEINAAMKTFESLGCFDNLKNEEVKMIQQRLKQIAIAAVRDAQNSIASAMSELKYIIDN